MFQRQAFGSISPFQSWGSAINPYFQYAVGANPFLQLAGGINPLQQSAGLMGQFHPFGGPTVFNPLGAALNPFVSQPFVPQLPLNPFISQPFVPQPPLFAQGAGVPPGFGIHSPVGQYGYGVSPLNPYVGYIGGIGAINPFQIDPTLAALALHQLNPVTHQLPIRPLGGQNPLEQIQAMAGNPFIGQPVDPYAALIPPQIVAQQMANPLQQIGRSQFGNPYPWGAGQFSIASSLNPLGI